MKILLAHAGKQHSYHMAKAMNDLDILEKFITSSYIGNKSIQEYLIKSGNTYWTRRFIEGLPGSRVESNWRFEVKEILYNRFFGKGSKTSNAVYARDQNFDAYLSKRMRAFKGCMYWGFQGSSWTSLQAARELGIPGIVELSTAHVTSAKKILGEESRLHPEWADSMDNLVFPAEYEKRLIEEPSKADFVIAASEFTRSTLVDAGIDEDRIFKLPLGFDASKLSFEPKPRKEGKLRVLYSGTITQRKGIKYLLEAMKILGKGEVELTLVGNIQGSGKALKSYEDYFTHLPAVSQQEMFDMYKDYDVLVLPSIFEGFGLVILEAMATGIPVITAPHSIGPEIIEDGQNGFIVPVRDSQKLADALSRFISFDSTELMSMRENSRKTALSYSWEEYKNRLKRLYLGLEQRIEG